jgi:hypothetical protein
LVAIEGISRGFGTVNIRKLAPRATRLTDLVELGSLAAASEYFLEAKVRAGLTYWLRAAG